MRILILAAAMLLTSCETATPMRGPAGEQWTFIECDLGLQYCFQKAADVCPAGYALIDQRDEAQPGLLQTTYTRNITIDCGQL